MACGCPVITTNASSLPEVTGQAAILVPTGDSAALAAALGQVLTDELLREELGRLGIRQSKRFDWASTASQVLVLMEEAARMGH
jgi:glycosyltransferase involved in cell wall biosynthesis